MYVFLVKYKTISHTLSNCSPSEKLNGSGTAQFKLEARVQVTRVYFVAPLEYFSKSSVSVDNCTRISRAIHAHVTSPNMLAYVRACTHVTMLAHSRKEFRSPRLILFSVQAHETTILMCKFVKLTCTI